MSYRLGPESKVIEAENRVEAVERVLAWIGVLVERIEDDDELATDDGDHEPDYDAPTFNEREAAHERAWIEDRR
jgi:hypothetical protein